MKTSEISSSNQSTQQSKSLLPNWLIWSLVIIAFLGFLDATYLTVAHYTGMNLKCSIFDGCGIVTVSKYSAIFGIPVALLGTLYYFTVLLLTLLYFDTKKTELLKLLGAITIAGFVASIYFVYLQFFVIKALCQYCMLSALTSTILFVLGLFVWKNLKKSA
ncbi:MAG: vitamin K epoxide reductase family protein [Patescibacteria group bacterium]